MQLSLGEPYGNGVDARRLGAIRDPSDQMIGARQTGGADAIFVDEVDRAKLSKDGPRNLVRYD